MVGIWWGKKDLTGYQWVLFPPALARLVPDNVGQRLQWGLEGLRKMQIKSSKWDSRAENTDEAQRGGLGGEGQRQGMRRSLEIMKLDACSLQQPGRDITSGKSQRKWK